MKLAQDALLLRIFVGESDRYEGKPLFEWVVRQARQMGLAGATVTRGLMGFGADSRLHTAKILRLSEDLPIVIELVDEEAKLNALLPLLDKAITEGLVTMERVRVLYYRHSGPAIRPPEAGAP